MGTGITPKLDAEMVRQWMDLNGRKYIWLAAELGITKEALYNRLENRSLAGVGKLAKIMDVSYKRLITADE